MPEYDPTNYPKQTTDDLTDGEVGRDMTGSTGHADTLKRWPSSHVVPDTYAGPPPSREFEVSGLGHKLTDRALAPDPDPTPSKVQPSIAPPPGHTAQP